MPVERSAQLRRIGVSRGGQAAGEQPQVIDLTNGSSAHQQVGSS